MFKGYTIVICCVVAMDLCQLVSSKFLFMDNKHDQLHIPRKGRATEDQVETFTSKPDAEDLTNGNASSISIDFPFRKNDSIEERLSIVEKVIGEFDVGNPYLVANHVGNIPYLLFPKTWKDGNVFQFDCKEGKPLTDFCTELLENEKRCPKQSRVCHFETSRATMAECSRNSNCSTGHRCCWDRCEMITICKPERPVPRKSRSPLFVDTQAVSNNSFVFKDGKVDMVKPITIELEKEKKGYVIFPENWNDNKQCQMKCPGNNGTLECCNDKSDPKKLCPISRRLCVIDLKEDDTEIDRCENDENCLEGQKCCYDRCHSDTVCKKVRRKKDY